MLLKYKTNNLRNIYKTICKKLPDSIFVLLGFKFFNSLVLNRSIHVYCVEKNNSIASIITVLNFKNYLHIKKNIILYLILNPFLIFKFLIRIIKASQKNSSVKINSHYLHILHLIIFKSKFMNMSLRKKDILFNRFYKKILKKHNSRIIFLCFDKKNKIAKKYYKRNNFNYYAIRGNFLYYRKVFK